MKTKLKKLEGGLRLKGKINKKPLITIITVVFNGAKTLERTIKSVINQTYQNFEYIIIDGCSTDGTLNIIKKFDKKIDYWVSESDKGIYDAMNKGVKMARGEYVYFLGCDDYLYSKKVLYSLRKQFTQKNLDMIYGDVVIKHPIYKKIVSPNQKVTLALLKVRVMPCHQGIFIKRELIIQEGFFDLKYKLASDYDLICKVYLNNHKIGYVHENIAFFSEEGKSSNRLKEYIESGQIIKKNFGLFFVSRYLIFQGIMIPLEMSLKKTHLLKRYQKIKYFLIKKLK